MLVQDEAVGRAVGQVSARHVLGLVMQVGVRETFPALPLVTVPHPLGGIQPEAVIERARPAIEGAASMPSEDYNLVYNTVDAFTWGPNTITGLDPLFVSTTSAKVIASRLRPLTKLKGRCGAVRCNS